MTWSPTRKHLICRDLQHSWRPLTAREVGSGYERVLQCDRCSSVKTQTLDHYGYITGSVMTYPDGYLRQGEGRLTKDDRADLRLGNLNA